MKGKKEIGLLMGVLVWAGVAGAEIVYQDDFSGAATLDAKDTVPEITLPGFFEASALTGLDGNGRLESTSPTEANANYRFRIDTDPLTADTSIAEISYKVTMRTPINDWVMIGFHEINVNGFLSAGINGGPIVQFNPLGVVLRGGTWGGGSESAQFLNTYTLGEVITAEMTYHIDAGTMDLAINGSTITNGFALNHEFPVGTLSDPVVYWAQAQLRFQPSVADGGAYIDSFEIEKTYPLPDPGYAGWAAEWGGINIGAETNDYDNDGLLNIYEYGLGGDPTNELDQGISPEFGTVDIGGTNWFGYIHPQLSDTNSGLAYSLELTTDLALGTWVNAGYVVSGTNVTSGEIDFVTNVTDMVDDQKFIRLIIE